MPSWFSRWASGGISENRCTAKSFRNKQMKSVVSNLKRMFQNQELDEPPRDPSIMDAPPCPPQTFRERHSLYHSKFSEAHMRFGKPSASALFVPAKCANSSALGACRINFRVRSKTAVLLSNNTCGVLERLRIWPLSALRKKTKARNRGVAPFMPVYFKEFTSGKGRVRTFSLAALCK